MTEPTNDPFEPLLDAFVYAPLGLLSMLSDAVPTLAQRGRQQSAGARMVGAFAIRGADRRVDEALGDARRHLGEFVRIMTSAADARVTGSGGQAPPAATDEPTIPGDPDEGDHADDRPE